MMIKYRFSCKGLKNPNGNPLTRNQIVGEETESFKRLKNEATIIISKTNTLY